MGKRTFVQFECSVCGARSKVYHHSDPEIEGDVPLGWASFEGRASILSYRLVCCVCLAVVLPIANDALARTTQALCERLNKDQDCRGILLELLSSVIYCIPVESYAIKGPPEVPA